MNCYPLPPSYTYKYSHSYSGYQPSYSTKSLHSDKSSTKSNPRWSRKSSKQAMPPADDFEKGLMRTSQESRSYSTFSSSADSMKSRSTSTSSASGSSSLRKPSMSTKSTKTNKPSDSNKSSRSWIKRIFVGDVDEDESEEDREAKRRERNAMWRNMSMGYEVSFLTPSAP